MRKDSHLAMEQLRSYKEAFEPDVIAKIDSYLAALDSLGKSPTQWKPYTRELQACLSFGMLLAAVSLSGSLIEMAVRDLNIALRVSKGYDGDMKFGASLDRELQADRDATFAYMVDELTPFVLTPSDSQRLKDFYREVRVPFAHVLTTRLTDKPEFFYDSTYHIGRAMDLEDRLEDKALDDVGFVINMLTAYRPWLVRRLSQ